MLPGCDFPGCGEYALFLVEGRELNLHACAVHLTPACAHVLEGAASVEVKAAAGADAGLREHAAYWRTP